MQTVFPYITDAALLLVFFGVIARAAHRGFARSILGILAWILASALALHYCAPVAQSVYDRFFQERIIQMAQENLSEKADAIEAVDVTTSVLQKLPPVVVHAAEAMDVDVDALTHRVQRFDPDTEDVAAAIEEKVLRPVVMAALKVIVFLIIVAGIVALAELLFSPMRRRMHEHTLLGSADRALGGVLGILKGAALVAVLAILLKVLGEIVQGRFGEAIAASRIIPFIENSRFANGLFS